MFQTQPKTHNLARTYSRQPYETIVQSGLSMTPAEMDKLRERGIPIAPPATGLQFYDMTDQNDFNVDAVHRRGADISDAYQLERGVRQKIKKAIAIDNKINAAHE